MKDSFKVSPKLASSTESSQRAKMSGICNELQRRTRHGGAEQSCHLSASQLRSVCCPQGTASSSPALALRAKPSARPATPPSPPSFRFPLDPKESETQAAGGQACGRSHCACPQGTHSLHQDHSVLGPGPVTPGIRALFYLKF